MFDADTANRGYGTYYIIDDDTVIKIEKSFGITAYSCEITKNGKEIYSETKEFRINEDYKIKVVAFHGQPLN